MKEIENTGYMNFSLRINSLQNDNLRVNLFPVVSEVLDIIGKEKRKVYKMRMGTTWKFSDFPLCSYKNVQVINLARTVMSDDGDHAK